MSTAELVCKNKIKIKSIERKNKKRDIEGRRVRHAQHIRN
jgi:hypothetical protein